MCFFGVKKKAKIKVSLCSPKLNTLIEVVSLIKCFTYNKTLGPFKK